MSDPAFRVLALDPGLDRSAFDCGSAPLDRYFHQQVTQDIRRRVAACFVALARDGQIAGYYTLAAASVLLADLPERLARKLPRYPSIPAVRLGRLAVSRSFKGEGLGGALLADAIDRARQAEIAAWALLVDAKGQDAAAFYRHHGFMEVAGNPLMLFLPLASAPT
jgi:GNAT superfamily N-acetyltransferase